MRVFAFGRKGGSNAKRNRGVPVNGETAKRYRIADGNRIFPAIFNASLNSVFENRVNPDSKFRGKILAGRISGLTPFLLSLSPPRAMSRHAFPSTSIRAATKWGNLGEAAGTLRIQSGCSTCLAELDNVSHRYYDALVVSGCSGFNVARDFRSDRFVG